MDITDKYAITIWGVFIFLLLANLRRLLRLCTQAFLLLITRLSYTRILRRFKHIGPWHINTILLLAFFIGLNVYLTFFNGFFNLVSVKETSARAANLALINLVPVIAGPSQSFLASLFGLSLRSFRKIHRSLALLSLLLVLVHVATAIATQGAFSLRKVRNVWALVAALWLPALIFLSCPWFRRPYELFAATHQFLAVILPVVIWQHLAPTTNKYFLVFLCAFPASLVLQLGIFLHKNAIGRAKEKLNKSAKSVEEAKAVQEVAGEGNAVIVNLKDIVQERLNREFYEKRLDKQIRLNHDIIQIVLELSRPVRVTEGQYIGLWIPAVGKFSFLQVHPFMVTSWSEGDSRQVRLLVEPRHGWTKKLLQYARINSNQARCRAFFTGPYGVRVPTRNYGIVLLVASGLGMVGQIPYLKQLIHDYNACRTRTRRIHLVWSLKTIDLAFVFEEILNEALIEDTLDDGRILSISIYIESGIADQVPFGRRAVVYSGPPNLEAIFRSERAGENIKRVQKEEEKREDMLILVSGTVDVRDNLHKIAQSSVRDKVSLVELEYQPDPPM